MDTELVKKAFLEAYKQTFGNITESCKAVGVNSRQTFYNWKEQDPEFAEAIKAIEPDELFMDFVESKMVQKIKDGDTAVLIFTAKCRGKKRGYVERTEHELSGKDGAPPAFEITLKI